MYNVDTCTHTHTHIYKYTETRRVKVKRIQLNKEYTRKKAIVNDTLTKRRKKKNTVNDGATVNRVTYYPANGQLFILTLQVYTV